MIPLLNGSSPEVIAENIKTLMRQGYSEKQALDKLSQRVPDEEVSDTQEPDSDDDDSGKQLGH